MDLMERIYPCDTPSPVCHIPSPSPERLRALMERYLCLVIDVPPEN